MAGEANVGKIFQSVSESLSTQIYKKASIRSPWLNAIPRGTFASGRGLVQTTFRVENSEPTTHDEAWAAAALTAGGDAGACADSFNAVEVGYTSDTYRPETYGLRGPVMCKTDQIYEHQAEQFLSRYITELAKRAQRTWENRYESIYKQLASKCVINTTGSYSIYDGKSKFWRPSVAGGADSGNLTGVSTISLQAAAAGAYINQDHLDEIAVELIRRGAVNPDSNGWIEMGPDGPIFTLLVGPEASKAIIKNDSPTGTRTDVRYASPSELMKRMGASRVLNNFRHMPVLTPARYGFGQTLATCSTTNTSVTVTTTTTDGFKGLCVGMPVTGTGIALNTVIASIAQSDYKTLTLSIAATATNGPTLSLTFGIVGQYSRVNTFEMVAATQGKKAVLTTGYKQAPYEEAIVMVPEVFTSELVKPVNSAAGVNWNPTNYMGDWIWVDGANNIEAGITDPLKKRGAHYCEYAHAPKPIFPEYGMTVIFKRI